MKMFLVSCFLTITFLSHGWGKHYLVETHDAKKYGEDGTDNFGPDITTIDAATLKKILRLKDVELDKFKSLPEKNKKKILNKIHKIIMDIFRNGGNIDYRYRPQFRETSFSREKKVENMNSDEYSNWIMSGFLDWTVKAFGPHFN